MTAPEAADKRRVFVAVPLPKPLLPRVLSAQEEIEPGPGIRLLSPEQLHITLAFIGHVGPEHVENARTVVRETPGQLGGEVLLDGFLCFPSARRARVVTLEVQDGREVFSRLFENVMSRLEGADVMQREKRPFRPHLTIARLKNPGPVLLKSDMRVEAFPVRSVCLYESRLRPTGAEYIALERKELTAPGGSEA